MKISRYVAHVVLRTGAVERLAVDAASLLDAREAARLAAIKTFPCRWLTYSVRLA